MLIKASTNSEWDFCDFAIVQLSPDWIEQQEKRLKLLIPFDGDHSFCSLNYYDWAVDFYRNGDDENLDIDELLGDEEWIYVELSAQQQETLTRPENSLDCFTLVMLANGRANYKAYGKHSGEEFWTEDFPINQIIGQQ